ncbi:MAG: alpha,alpha-trehalase TreF [Bacteroidetes bacterium]|nr:MAG: alpha,alpha-trehalase TreF [Bacteroidota bacterium]
MALLACQPSPAPETIPAATGWQGPQETFPRLFREVQMARVFPDSKTFADCTPRQSPAEIRAAYAQASDQAIFDLSAFVEAHFELPQAYASGFVADMSRPVMSHIEALWPVLTRQADAGGEAGTLIPLPHPYVVPGGRFGEVYYWDSYFTMLGLSVSDSSQSLIGSMVDNFAYLLDTVGYIPNGNRTYYLGRSQPPFFSLMVRLLVETDSSRELTTYLPALQQEYDFWMDGASRLSTEKEAHRRVVRMPDGAILNRYWDDRPEPRPESYREDVELAETTDRPADSLYRNLRAACESGWDFSSRWLADSQTLATIRTTELIPPDLNSLMYHLEVMLQAAYTAAGDSAHATHYGEAAKARAAAIRHYCWSDRYGFFGDYDWVQKTPTGIPSGAMVFPLALGIADTAQAEGIADALQRYLLRPGGLVTTPFETGQQWDAPNGWAPLQYMAIWGLEQYGQAALAKEIRDRWVRLNVRVYQQTGKLVEKYHVEGSTSEAGGGEYPLQDGFGWTNGVLLYLLRRDG